MDGTFAARRSSSWHPCRTVAVAIGVITLALACTRAAVPTRVAPIASAPDSVAAPEVEGRTLDNLIAGRVAGVTAALTSSKGLQIRIRGSDRAPLVVVDGTELDETGSISLLNPYDIERVEVLKNPADVALYGARGANGVVRITTRRPGTR